MNRDRSGSEDDTASWMGKIMGMELGETPYEGSGNVGLARKIWTCSWVVEWYLSGLDSIKDGEIWKRMKVGCESCMSQARA